MASKTVVLLEDDMVGGEADETVQFGLDGQRFEIDLNEENATRLRETLAEYVEVARKSGGRSRTPRARSSAENSAVKRSGKVVEGLDAKAVRSWAESNGHHVSHRGRISRRIIEAFRAAGN